TFEPAFAAVMRRYYDFVVRYENVLSDRRLVTAPRDDETAAVEITGRRGSPIGIAGMIWTIRRSMPGFRTLSLINLSDAEDTLWNAPKPPVRALEHLAVSFQVGARVTSLFIADPDRSHPIPIQTAFTSAGEGAATRIRFEVPRLEYWTLVVARVED
ncbi:MAG: glycoside hydrolase family 66 protein, partial [Chloroflexota bacterium]